MATIRDLQFGNLWYIKSNERNEPASAKKPAVIYLQYLCQICSMDSHSRGQAAMKRASRVSQSEIRSVREEMEEVSRSGS